MPKMQWVSCAIAMSLFSGVIAGFAPRVQAQQNPNLSDITGGNINQSIPNLSDISGGGIQGDTYLPLSIPAIAASLQQQLSQANQNYLSALEKFLQDCGTENQSVEDILANLKDDQVLACDALGLEPATSNLKNCTCDSLDPLKQAQQEYFQLKQDSQDFLADPATAALDYRLW